MPRAIKGLLTGNLDAKQQGCRHINTDSPFRINSQFCIACKNGNKNLWQEHGNRPQQRAVCKACNQQQAESLLHTVNASGAVIKADNGLRALGHSLKREHGELHDTGHNSHGPYCDISAVF